MKTITQSFFLTLCVLSFQAKAQSKYSYELNIGNSHNFINIHDPNNYLDDFGLSSVTFGFSLSKEFDNNFYVRGNFRAVDYWVGYSFEQRWGNIVFKGGGSSQAFWGLHCDVEGGYTFKNANDFVFASLGVSINNGFAATSKGFQGASGYKVSDPELDPDLISEYYDMEFLDNHWMLGVGIHLSRKFYIYKQFFLPLRINYNYGFLNTYRTEFVYEKHSLKSSVFGQSYLKGTSFSIEAGIGITLNSIK